eukprot:m.101408 g.101408  ORF g.101408 m.101408 type:complete len:229 (-) comp15659_c1_seq1:468-1154(-)
MGVVVILPYRSREAQLLHLLSHLLKDPGRRNIRAVVIAEQGNLAPFNRGAIKNAGFDLAVRALNLQPTDTVCFHDVDVCPEQEFGAYPDCLPNEIWHLYGHEHCLGGVVCVTVADFVRMGKFSHWDRWGREDTDLMQAAKRLLVHVNHTRFVNRFKPVRHGFFEVDSQCRRQTVDAIRQQLREKIVASRDTASGSTSQDLVRGGTLVVFGTTMVVPTLRRDVVHGIFL